MSAKARLALLAWIVVLVLAIVVITSGCEPRAVAVLADGQIVVLGDGTRGDPTTASTTVQPAPLTPLCHAGDTHASEVSAVIRAHFAAGMWSWACRVAWCESRFNPTARNRRSGALGLFQVMPRTWARTAVALGANLLTFDGNARVAAHILAVQGTRAWSCR